MKRVLYFFVFLFFVCLTNAQAGALISEGQDPINQVDVNNLKQGKWVFTNKEKKLPGYTDDQVVEEGFYKDNKKTGKWTHYYANKKKKHELTFENNRPNGYAVFYYKNGNKSEEGFWKNNRWIGEYKYYYENGQMAYEWNYNSQGKREGEQKYYHENGKVMIEGNWAAGKETGVIKEYYADGNPKSEKFFNNGLLDPAKTVNYKEKKTPPTNQVAQKDDTPVEEEPKQDEIKPKKVAPANLGELNGYNVVRDSKGRVKRKGEFSKGFLTDGEVYQYGASGKKIKTTIYKEGKLVEVIDHEKQKTPNKQ